MSSSLLYMVPVLLLDVVGASRLVVQEAPFPTGAHAARCGKVALRDFLVNSCTSDTPRLMEADERQAAR
eukprot:15035820-Heterocapsa_arctica.AAC.1